MNDALASWVPAPVLAGLVLLLLGVMFNHLREKLKEQKTKDEDLAKEIALLKADTQGKFDRVCERFDARIGVLSQDVAVIKAVLERAK